MNSPVKSQGFSRIRRDHSISLVNVVISWELSPISLRSAFKPHHSINFKIQEKKDVEASLRRKLLILLTKSEKIVCDKAKKNKDFVAS